MAGYNSPSQLSGQTTGLFWKLHPFPWMKVPHSLIPFFFPCFLLFRSERYNCYPRVASIVINLPLATLSCREGGASQGTPVSQATATIQSSSHRSLLFRHSFSDTKSMKASLGKSWSPAGKEFTTSHFDALVQAYACVHAHTYFLYGFVPPCTPRNLHS